MSSEDIFVSPDDYEEEPVELSEEDEAEFVEATRLGKAQEEFEVMGNTVVLHTLSIKETLESAKVAKSYKETYAEALALKTAMVASALDTINGEEFYRPIAVGENETRARFKRLSERYYSDFVNELYVCYRELEEKQYKIINKIKKVQA